MQKRKFWEFFVLKCNQASNWDRLTLEIPRRPRKAFSKLSHKFLTDFILDILPSKDISNWVGEIGSIRVLWISELESESLSPWGIIANVIL